MDDKDIKNTKQNKDSKEDSIQRLYYLAERMIFRQSPVYKEKNRTGYFYFINDKGISEVVKVEDISRQEFDRLRDAIAAEIQHIHGRIYSPKDEKNRRRKEDKEVTEEIHKMEGGLSAPRMAEVKKQYDKAFAAQVMQIAKRQEWLTEIIEELGISTLFMILQIAKIAPARWYEEIEKYKEDPKAFLKFADQYLVALFEAKEDAEKYIELREKYAYCIAKEVYYEHEIIDYKKLVQELYTELNAAISLLSKSGLQRFLLWLALRNMN